MIDHDINLEELKEIELIYIDSDYDGVGVNIEFFEDTFKSVTYLSSLKDFSVDLEVFHFIIADTDFFDSEGIQTLAEINKNQIVIIFSNFENSKRLNEAIKVGLTSLIAKPIDDKSSFLNSLNNYSKNRLIQEDLIEKTHYIKQQDHVVDEHLLMTKTDLNGVITDVSNAYTELFGYKKNDIVGKTHKMFKDKATNDRDIISDLWTTILNDNVWSGELVNIKMSGEECWLSTTIYPVFDLKNKKKGYISIQTDITDTKRYEELSITDTLTGLYNNREFEIDLNAAINKASWKKHKLAIALIDIDNFKAYNESFGYLEGDNVIKELANILKDQIGFKIDNAFRISGEKFTIIIIDRDDNYIRQYAENLKYKFSENNYKLSQNSNKYLTLSIGVANVDFGRREYSAHELLSIADESEIEAKNSGGDRVVFADAQKYLNNFKNLDKVTKLKNRVELLSCLNVINSEAMIMILNITNLSMIYELYGPAIVDDILITKAEQLKSIIVDEEASVYKLSLNEFVIVITNSNLFEKYLSIIKYSILVDDSVCNIEDKNIATNINVGIAYGISNLLNKADTALKKAITNNESFYVYDKSMSTINYNEKSLKQLKVYREALHEGNIIPFLQPIVDVHTNEVIKYEALARLKLDDGEIVSPYYFLKASKDDKTFENFTRQVMQKIFHIYSKNNVDISINLTYENVNSKTMINYIKNRLEKYGGKGITFEIVESEDIEDYSVVENFILLVKDYGCKISIDDFGSGYSNFSNLIKFNLDYIKLDGSLVNLLIEDDNVKTLVSAIVSFAKQSDIKMIAEFVSSQEIADAIMEFGIDYSQGYHFGKPLPPEEYGLKV